MPSVKVKDQSLGYTRTPTHLSRDGRAIARVIWWGRLALLLGADVSPPPFSAAFVQISVIEVCPAAQLHVRRILSLSIKWTLDPPPPMEDAVT